MADENLDDKNTSTYIKPMPALYNHTVDAYRSMKEEAQTKEYEPGAEGLIYEGYITKLFRDTLNLSTPYFTKVLNELKRMDCVRQIRRGGSTTTSLWLLLQEPDQDLWYKMNVNKIKSGLGRKSDLSVLRQADRDLSRRLDVIEKALGIS